MASRTIFSLTSPPTNDLWEAKACRLLLVVEVVPLKISSLVIDCHLSYIAL